jgi:hypothetical protein
MSARNIVYFLGITYWLFAQTVLQHVVFAAWHGLKIWKS